MFAKLPHVARQSFLAVPLLVGCAISLVTSAANAEPLFTWMNGPKETAQPGVYTGLAAHPGARYDPATWTDLQGNLWLHGGYGRDSAGTGGYLGDLWRYDRTSNTWTFVGGPQIVNQNASHGTMGVASPTNNPSGRWAPSTWITPDGRFWLFGGLVSHDDFGATGQINDLWVYDPATGLWTWVSGSNAINDPGVLGSGPAAVPAACEYPFTWMDAAGNLWLYGGYGRLTVGFGYLSDLWKFDPATTQWTLVSGSNAVIPPVHGTKGVPAPTNYPGSRAYGRAFTDEAGNVYLFGGFDTTGAYNDLWRLDPTTGLWTWIHGSNLIDQFGVYGTMGVPADLNQPGTRGYTQLFNDHSGNIWLFGGYGRDSVDPSNNELQDLWKYNIATNRWSWEKGSNLGDAPGNWGVLGVSAATNIPSGRDGHAGWVAPDGTFWIFGGYAFQVGNTHADLWRLTVTYTADVSVSLTPSSSSITLGQPVTYTTQITNSGPDTVDVVTTLTLGGEPLEFNPSLAPVGAAAVPAIITYNAEMLAPGETRTFITTSTPTLPGTAVSTAELFTNADDPNPANNTASTSVQVVQGDGPDLVPGGSVTQSCRVSRAGTARCRLKTTAVVLNSGNQDAAQSTLRVYLSDDAILDSADQQLRDVRVRKLKVGRATTKRVQTSLPSGTTASGKFVIVVADALGVVTEGNEFNNKTAFGPIP